MKEHMSITLDATIAHLLRRYALQERRSISGVVEMAIETYLNRNGTSQASVITAPGAYKGHFSRTDTYGER